jgi:hypothetical protein
MSTSLPARPPLDRWIPALLLIAGSLLFLAGGSRHPHIGADPLGAELGSDQFWRHFAQMILDRPGWSTFHAMILMGPVLWALATPGLLQALPRPFLPVAELGRGALVIGATLWVVEFVLDGYLGVRYATMIQRAGPEADALPIALFGANAYMMARLGMVSLVLFGVSTICVGVAALASWRAHRGLALVGALGLVLGLWPITAALRGRFWPGPFTYQYWTPLAIGLGIWFLTLGVVVARAKPPRA